MLVTKNNLAQNILLQKFNRSPYNRTLCSLLVCTELEKCLDTLIDDCILRTPLIKTRMSRSKHTLHRITFESRLRYG